jgi:hypothetical protein
MRSARYECNEKCRQIKSLQRDSASHLKGIFKPSYFARQTISAFAEPANEC